MDTFTHMSKSLAAKCLGVKNTIEWELLHEKCVPFNCLMRPLKLFFWLPNSRNIIEFNWLWGKVGKDFFSPRSSECQVECVRSSAQHIASNGQMTTRAIAGHNPTTPPAITLIVRGTRCNFCIIFFHQHVIYDSSPVNIRLSTILLLFAVSGLTPQITSKSSALSGSRDAYWARAHYERASMRKLPRAGVVLCICLLAKLSPYRDLEKHIIAVLSSSDR